MLRLFLHLFQQVAKLLIVGIGVQSILHNRNRIFKPALANEQIGVTKNRFGI